MIVTLWFSKSPSVIMYLRWAASAPVMLGKMTAPGELTELNRQWRANRNRRTMGRPKISHILSQLPLAAHLSNPQRAVSLLNSPGTPAIPVSCYFATLLWTHFILRLQLWLSLLLSYFLKRRRLGRLSMETLSSTVKKNALKKVCLEHRSHLIVRIKSMTKVFPMQTVKEIVHILSSWHSSQRTQPSAWCLQVVLKNLEIPLTFFKALQHNTANQPGMWIMAPEFLQLLFHLLSVCAFFLVTDFISFKLLNGLTSDL